MKANEFLEIIGNQRDNQKSIKLQFGYVDPAYTSGRPKIIFDGVDGPSVKQYPYIGSIAANDRVMVLNGVILGKIN